MKTSFSRKDILLVAVSLLAVISVIFGLTMFANNRSTQWELRRLKAVPRIGLGQGLSFQNNIAYGSVKGFVKFKNPADQPKDFGQYVIIEAQNYRDDLGNQVFTYQDIFAFHNLPPSPSEKTILSIVDNTSDQLILKDDSGSTFIIMKKANKVLFSDQSGDQTELIVDNSKYEDFILSTYN